MRSNRPIQAALVLAFCSAFATAAPRFLTPQEEGPQRTLKDRDLKNVAKRLGAWFEMLDEGKDTLETEYEFREELKKFNEKKLKGGDLLKLTADLGFAIYGANDYGRKNTRGATGKVITRKVERGDLVVEYSIWTPAKYRGNKGPYPVIISIPEEGENPKDHITNRWTNGDLKASTIIVSPKMPGDSNLWTERDGRAAVFITFADIMTTWAVDRDRVFIGGRVRGGEAALEFAHSSADRFAGAFCWASDGGDGLNPENLTHVPVLICGGGANTTAFAERAKDAGVEGITIAADAGLDDIVAWIDKKSRKAYPDKVTIAPAGRYPTKGYWIQFAAMKDMSNVRITGEINRETNTITLTGKGVRDVSLFLSDGLVDMDRPVTVIANGAESKDTFQRSVNTFLELVRDGKNDSGRIYTATKQYHLPAIAGEEDDESGG